MQTINYANKTNDAHAYYSALYELFCSDFYENTDKLVDKGEYSWLINSMNIQKKKQVNSLKLLEKK